MKTILLFLSLAIFLPLSAFATCTTDTSNQVLRDVLDTDGNPLNKSSRYFVLPAYYIMDGGGLILANLENTTCPTSVVQSNSARDDGMAVIFTPRESKHQKILVSSPLNIHFYINNPFAVCSNVTVWKVDNYSKLSPRHNISTGAKLGNTSDVSSWFQIKPVNSKYKLVFCPYGQCQNIGFGAVKESGYYRLVLSEKPFLFEFKYDDRIGKAEA